MSIFQSAVLLFTACDANPSATSGIEIQAELDERVSTVITARWTTEEPSRGKVVYGVVGETSLETPWEAEPTTSHEVVLLGMPTDANVELVGVGDDEITTESTTITTGSLPAGWPGWSTPLTEPTWEGWIFIGIGGGFSGVMAIDNQARPVWWWEAETPNSVMIRVMPTVDRSGVYVARSGGEYPTGGDLAKLTWTGEVESNMNVTDLSHDFVERPDGGLAAIVLTQHGRDGEVCIADGISEFEWGGSPELKWDAWDTFSEADAPCADAEGGFTHANAIDWDEGSGQYVFGTRNVHTISVVDRASYATVESFGINGTFEPASEEDAFVHQHQFVRLSEDRYLVFDDGAQNRPYSRVIEVELNRTDQTFSVVWDHTPDPSLYVYLLGDLERLDNGNTLVDWSTAGRLQEITPEGEAVWQVDTELGHGFGYMNRVESLYDLR